MNDLKQALREMQRVLKNDGFFYCSTYGKNHMKEIRELVEEFDSRIVLSNTPLYDEFGLHNGEKILKKYFKDVHLYLYEDALEVNRVDDLVDYILSCHGNQKELLSKRIDEFKMFIKKKMKEQGSIYITKECGVFECTK
jgi:SAM-dependent methyltransferase